VEDIQDLRSRLLGQLVAGTGRASSVSDKIVVARGIPPSLVVELKAEGARGIITERGGPTSHGALLARSMGVPAVTGILDIVLLVRSGETLLIDGGKGKVIVSPSADTLQNYQADVDRLRSRRISSLSFRNMPACSRDGVSVSLQANVGVAADMAAAREKRRRRHRPLPHGVPFHHPGGIPDFGGPGPDLSQGIRVLSAGPVHFRLLDLGGDKFVTGGILKPDRNPFSGYRSIRVLLDNPAVLHDQVRAFLRAAGPQRVGILIPMVTSLGELRAAIEHIREAIDDLEDNNVHRDPQIGAMIEVPGAVEIASELAREVDFFSIGSK
jgi:phosphoenolpyruvate-protein kinase (PTS system EI component)